MHSIHNYHKNNARVDPRLINKLCIIINVRVQDKLVVWNHVALRYKNKEYN